MFPLQLNHPLLNIFHRQAYRVNQISGKKPTIISPQISALRVLRYHRLKPRSKTACR